jgi:hypothetical protein
MVSLGGGRPVERLAYDRSLSSDAGWGFPDQVASFRAAG